MTCSVRARARWEAVDMLRKFTIVAVGSILNDPTTQAVMVIQITAVWLCVQCIVQPYRFKEDNVLKMACDLAIVMACACELAVHWGSTNESTDDANYFMAMVWLVALLCVLAVFVKVCRVLFQLYDTLRFAQVVLNIVDGAGHSSSRAEIVPKGLEEEFHAIHKYRAVGVASERHQGLLRAYFERVRVSEKRRQQMFQHSGVPWAFVSSPEFLHTGEPVMAYIETICQESPWQFKQAFDWASSGNCYPNDNPAWTRMGPAMAAWGEAIKAQDGELANKSVKYQIAPTFLNLDWYKSGLSFAKPPNSRQMSARSSYNF